MAKLRILIVDDEPLAREKVATLLSGDHEVEIIGECGNGLAAVAAIEALAPDLVFLDVQMPELDGFGVLDALSPDTMPSVIFVTAYVQYAIRAFEVHALDYLLKPFDRGRFEKAMERARQQIARDRSTGVNDRIVALLADLKAKPKTLERLVVKDGGRVFFLRVEEIDWIEAAANYVQLHVGRHSHLLRETVNSIGERLDPDRFIRIHRSIIVNIDRIRELHPLFHGKYAVVLHDGTQLTSSRGCREQLRRLLDRSA